MSTMGTFLNNHLFDFQLKNPMYPAFVFASFCGSSAFHTIGRKNLLLNNRFHQESCITTTKKPWPSLHVIKHEKEFTTERKSQIPKLAIIGGGLCGVTAAKAIASRLQTSGPEKAIDITIFESDKNSFSHETDLLNDKVRGPPTWKAAAARNANSLGKQSWIMIILLLFCFLYLKD